MSFWRQAEKTRCPLCRSVKTRKLRVIDVEPVVVLWRDFFKIDIKPEFGRVSEMELWRCRRCAVSFFLPGTLTGSGDMYAKLADYGGYYVGRKWEYEVAISDLRGHNRILEIGCGSGNFMTLAHNEAALPIEGIEQSEHA